MAWKAAPKLARKWPESIELQPCRAVEEMLTDFMQMTHIMLGNVIPKPKAADDSTAVGGGGGGGDDDDDFEGWGFSEEC